MKDLDEMQTEANALLAAGQREMSAAYSVFADVEKAVDAAEHCEWPESLHDSRSLAEV